MTPRDVLLDRARPQPTDSLASPQVEIVVPVRDEERDLGPSVRRLVGYLRASFPFSARITIADNGSADGTWPAALGLAASLDEVRAVQMAEPGRGRALRSIWSASDADVLAYMDVDLSTDLNALLPLVAPLISGHSDVAIGTRLARGARVIRGPRREIISRGYNLLLHATLGTRFSDAQCGFKAISRTRARVLLPLTRDTGWFFDTELLVLAQRAGLRIHEVPVDWTDDTDSRVRVLATMLADLRGIARLGIGLLLGSITVPYLGDPVPPAGRRAGTPLAAGPLGPRPGEPELPGAESGGKRLSQPEPGEPGLGGRARLVRAASWPGHAVASRASRQAALQRQLARFALIGAVSTIGYLALYLMLRSALPAQPANALSLLVTAVANTAANRRYTFGISGWLGAGRHHLRGLLAFGAGLAATAIALAGLHAAVPRPAQGLEVMVLAGASMAATLARFALQRHWVFAGAGQAGRYDSDPLGRQPGGGQPGRRPAG